MTLAFPLTVSVPRTARAADPSASCAPRAAALSASCAPRAAAPSASRAPCAAAPSVAVCSSCWNRVSPGFSDVLSSLHQICCNNRSERRYINPCSCRSSIPCRCTRTSLRRKSRLISRLVLLPNRLSLYSQIHRLQTPTLPLVNYS